MASMRTTGAVPRAALAACLVTSGLGAALGGCTLLRPGISRSAGALAPVPQAVPPGQPPGDVEAMLGEIDRGQLDRIVKTLAGFGTRHTLSDTTSPTRGIGAARSWIEAELRRYAGAPGARQELPLVVTREGHQQAPAGQRIPREVEIVNVVAELPGTMPEARARRYYVIGHYDSRVNDVMDAQADAPGANDDASGVAVVMELARVMSRRRYDATLVFMATAAEEQGLYGAKLHAAAARAAGLDVRAVLNNDIVGDPGSPRGGRYDRQIRVFSEGLPGAASPEQLAALRAAGVESDSPSRQLARAIAEVAAWQDTEVRPLLVFRRDRFLRGGDQTAFTELGVPAVRFTVVDENYDRQHQNVRSENGKKYGDLPEFVDATYLRGVARLNAAALAHLANAPSAPADVRILTQGLSTRTALRWSRPPEPDLAGYEVVWRETTSPTWQHVRDVGAVTETTLDLNKDNWLFGVRAYDKQGYRSPVTFPRVGRGGD
jgi:Zn-dependent M28 family amino/carboxypeptidase